MSRPKIRSGEIWLADLRQTTGREMKGTRPVVIISGDAFHSSGLCIACSLTSTIRKLPGDIVLLPTNNNGLKEKSEVMVGQIRSISQNRLVHQVGVVKKSELNKIYQGLDLILNR